MKHEEENQCYLKDATYHLLALDQFYSVKIIEVVEALSLCEIWVRDSNACLVLSVRSTNVGSLHTE